MDMISVSNARTDLYNLIKSVNESHIPVHIHNKNGSAAVLISADDWRSIEETLHLNSVPDLAESIIEGINEPLDEMVNADDVEW